MSRRRFKVKEIVNKVRAMEVLLSKRKVVARACKHIDATVDASQAYKLPRGVL